MSKAPGPSAPFASPSAPSTFTPRDGTWTSAPAWARAAVPEKTVTPIQPAAPPNAPSNVIRRPDAPRLIRRTSEEQRVVDQIGAQIAQRLASDHNASLKPDVDTPFRDAEDAVARLLPYHVWQHPKEDLSASSSRNAKGKGKASEVDLLRQEISETRTALQCMKRKRALEDRFRRIRTRAGKTSPKDAMYVLEAGMLESERAALQALKSEFSQARNTLSQLEKEARARNAAATAQTQRPTPTINTQVPGSFVTGYPGYGPAYVYATPTSTVNPAQLAAPSASTSTTTMSTSNTPVASTPSSAYTPSRPAGTVAPGFIPVQLPITSLPSLTAIGILPVSAAALPAPTSGQPQPAAILRGLTSEGRMMNLEINVAMLQPSQTHGLAMLLNSIMTRNGVTPNVTGGHAGPTPVSQPVPKPISGTAAPTNNPAS